MTDIRIPGMTYGCGLAHAEREALETYHSTDALLHRAARQANPAHDVPVELGTGGGRTYRSTKASQKPLADPGHDGAHGLQGAAHVALELADHAIEKFLMKRGMAAGAAGLAAPAAGALAVYDVASLLPRAWRDGDEQRTALYRDARFAAIVWVLDGLPAHYVEGELSKRREVAASTRAPANRIAMVLKDDRTALALLQLRCDEGMKVAERCVAARLTRDDFLAARDDVRARYHADAAFRVGFDALLAAQAAGPATFERTLTELRKREAKCSSTTDVVYTG
jgi:hypothetical protein